VTTEPRADEFELVALPHLNDLFRTASRVIGDRAQASDLVQETYLQAWKSFHRFTPGTNCRAWLYKILFHVIHHHRRKVFRMSRYVAHEDEPSLEERLAFEPPVPHDLSDEDVIAAVEKLPAHYREVLLLVDVEELAYKEAADVLGVPIGTIMSRLSRGRAQLRAALAGFAQAYGIQNARAAMPTA
jgi:RNA polymerase sigma-70 factor (ECF subfamily)